MRGGERRREEARGGERRREEARGEEERGGERRREEERGGERRREEARGEEERRREEARVQILDRAALSGGAAGGGVRWSSASLYGPRKGGNCEPAARRPEPGQMDGPPSEAAAACEDPG
ncbi:hypothetical protein EYF80_046246 [Liparis tanakae]|uniref:Uncharacterized protein n=1 Tax=Liparis tanakae TaxID=230148 RepID=A0A4Z2FS43_9TELE|nr:hypothetical protein EYF80_046246 [Liparis tanakae]